MNIDQLKFLRLIYIKCPYFKVHICTFFYQKTYLYFYFKYIHTVDSCLVFYESFDNDVFGVKIVVLWY